MLPPKVHLMAFYGIDYKKYQQQKVSFTKGTVSEGLAAWNNNFSQNSHLKLIRISSLSALRQKKKLIYQRQDSHSRQDFMSAMDNIVLWLQSVGDNRWW